MRLTVSSRTRIRMHALIHLNPYCTISPISSRKSLRARLHRPDPIRNPSSRPSRELERASPIEATKESTSALHPATHLTLFPPPAEARILPPRRTRFNLHFPRPTRLRLTSLLTSPRNSFPLIRPFTLAFVSTTCAREIVTPYPTRRFASNLYERRTRKGEIKFSSLSHISFKVICDSEG